MATEKPILSDSGLAAADYSSMQYHAMYLNTAEAITLVATLGARVDGVLQDAPESGEIGTIMQEGVSKVLLEGTVAIGDPLCANASGHFIKCTCDNYFVAGRALETGVSGDVISMFITLEGFNVIANATADGIGTKKYFRATFDPSANSGERTVASHGLGVYLPDNAVIVRAFYQVITTFTSATDSATIALTIPTDDVAGIAAATAISAGGNVWDAGWHEAIQDGTAATFSEQTTAIREITATVAVDVLTAGKLILFGEYVIGA